MYIQFQEYLNPAYSVQAELEKTSIIDTPLEDTAKVKEAQVQPKAVEDTTKSDNTIQQRRGTSSRTAQVSKTAQVSSTSSRSSTSYRYCLWIVIAIALIAIIILFKKHKNNN